MASERQANFGAGELSPSLWGRTDMDRYGEALKRLFNAFVSRQGSPVSRPGTQYLGTCAAAKVRLLPFEFSDSDTLQNYLLELSANTMRVWQSGFLQGQPQGGNDVLGPVPYQTADLNKVRIVQSLDVIFIACTGYPPATLSRTLLGSDLFWIYAPVVSVASLPAWDSTTTFGIGDMAQNGSNFISIQSGNTNHALSDPNYWQPVVSLSRPVPNVTAYLGAALGDLNSSDTGHAAVPWDLVATLITKDANTGVESESATVPVVPANLNDFSAYGAGTTYTALACVKGADGNFYESLQAGNVGHDPATSPTWWTPIGGAVANGSAWASRQIYNAGTVVIFTDAHYYASLVDGNLANEPASGGTNFWTDLGTSGVTLSGSQTDVHLVIYPDEPLKVTLNAPTISPSSPNFVCARLYRGRAGIFGWAVDSKGTTATDVGADPDYERAPPQGLNPFEVKDDSGAVIRTETPMAVAFFEDRLFFIGTRERPSYIFASATGDYWNFDQRQIATDDQGVVFALSSRKREIARAAVGVDRLFAFTGSSAWAIQGANNSPLVPDAVSAQVAVTVGTEWVEPLVGENTILWVRDKGTGVRNVTYSFQQEGYHSNDLGLTAEHLFRGFQIVDWAWAVDPWSVIWAVRNDGVVLSLTYAPDEGVWGWARHKILSPDTGSAGAIQSVCVVAEGDEDVVYMAMSGAGSAVARLLRFSTRLEAPNKMAVPLDGFTQYINPAIFDGQVTCGALDYLDGRTVYAVIYEIDANNAPLLDADEQIIAPTVAGPFVVSAGIVAVPVTGSRVAVFVGMTFTSQVRLLPLAEVREKQKIVAKCSLELQATGTVQVGVDFDHLVPVQVDSSTDVAKVLVEGVWGTDGEAAIEVNTPVLLTLRAVTREVDSGQA